MTNETANSALAEYRNDAVSNSIATASSTGYLLPPYLDFDPLSNDSVIICVPDICGGEPIVAGTRINVTHIWNLSVILGWSIKKIQSEYPQLTYQQIDECLKHVEARPHLQMLAKGDGEE